MPKLPLLSMSAVGLALLFSPGPTYAQSDEARLDELVVTARRTEENLQTTPVAVTAVNAEGLIRSQVVDAMGLQRTAPSLVIANGTPGGSFYTFVSIRGQGNLLPLIANDPAVATYVDGVYIARPAQGVMDLNDIDRVEVLRGPQGTLFGRNTTGGAINILTADPTGDFSVALKGELGAYDYHQAGIVANLPLDGEQLGLRLTYNFREHDGYGHNPLLDREVQDLTSHFVRGKLRFAPAESPFDLTISADYNKIRNNGPVVALSAVDPNATAVNAIFRSALGAPTFDASPSFRALTQYLHSRSAWFTDYGVGFPANSPPVFGRKPFDQMIAWGGGATMTYAGDAFTLKSITGFRKNRVSNLADIDGTPLALLALDSDAASEAWSQELQINGSFGDRFDYIAGAYYFRETGHETERFQPLGFVNPVLERFFGLPAGALGPSVIALNDADAVNTSAGVFAQGYYDLTEALRLTAGLRWTWDKRKAIIKNLQDAAHAPLARLANGSLNCMVIPDQPGTCEETHVARFDYPAYTLGLDYKASDDLFLYAKTSRASKAGGWNLRIGSFPAFEPEKATDVELGAKYTTPDHRLRLNAAAFYTWTSGVQRNAFAVINGQTTQFLRNAGKTRIYGAELEATALPVQRLELTANLSLLRGRYKKGSFFDDLGGGVRVDRSDEELPQLPRVQFAVGATYTVPVSIGQVVGHLDYSYVSAQSFAPATPPPGTPAAGLAALAIQNDLDRMAGYGILSGRLSMEMQRSGAEIYVFGRNLLNKKYVTRPFADVYASLGWATEYVGEPRTYGVGVRYTFGR